VGDHGRPLVDDPTRLDGVATLGLDETSFLNATRLAPAQYVTGLVNQVRRRTQQATLGHRAAGAIRCTASQAVADRGRAAHQSGTSAAAGRACRRGDATGEVAAAWQGKERLRAI
jgi:hypothetical protein